MGFLSVRQFASLMRQRVTIAPKTGYDSYGKATYGTGVVYQCAVVGMMKMVRTGKGEEAPSKQQVYLMSNAAIRPEDQITLSTEDAGSTESFAINPPILSVGRYPFTAGQFFTEVDL